MQLVDARPPVRWTEDEICQAVERQQKRAGALVALVKARVLADASVVRGELNQLAGGQASRRVAVLAHNAMLAQEALELQSLDAEVAAGEERKGLEASLRSMSGLSVFASQALDKAYEAAREEGKRANPVADLRRTIGLGVNDDPVDAGSSMGAGSTETHGETVTGSAGPHDRETMGQAGLMSILVDGTDDSCAVGPPLNPPGGGGLGPPLQELPTPTKGSP